MGDSDPEHVVESLRSSTFPSSSSSSTVYLADNTAHYCTGNACSSCIFCNTKNGQTTQAEIRNCFDQNTTKLLSARWQHASGDHPNHCNDTKCVLLNFPALIEQSHFTCQGLPNSFQQDCFSNSHQPQCI